MLDDQDIQDAASTDSSAQGSTPAPQRRRRAASRPAGPPVAQATQTQNPEAATTPQTPLAVTPAVEQPAPAAAAQSAASQASAPGADQAPAEQPAKRPARRRATRAQAAPAEPTAAVEPTAAAEQNTTVEPSPEPQAPAADPAPRKRSTNRRTRSTTGTSSDESASTPSAVAEPAVQAPVDELLESAPRTRRRRVADQVADPFQAPDPEAVLQHLAASIAGQTLTPEPSPQADQASEPAETKPARRTRGRGRKPVEPVVADEQVTEDSEATDQPADDQAPVEDEQAEVEAEQTLVDDENEQDADDESTEDELSEDEASDEDAAEDDSIEDGDDEPREGRRRRRRRGGRRRRRSGADGESGPDDTDGSDDADGEDESATDEASEQGDSEEAGSDSGRRRRRRRRRRGEDTSGAEDDPSDVVVRVREPRRRSGGDEITSIEGSTRMAAKKMRRQEGRAAGRRRAPILSEAEFLARRESVERKMIIRQREDYTQLAVLEDGVLVEHYVDRAGSASMIGNIYLGRVQNVLPGMEAAFIDIGRGRNAVLYAGEIDWEAYGAQGEQRKVEHVLKSGQTVLVQVSKDPVGAKGARLTSHISIPGRYLVYSPGGHLSGISRKLADTERHRLKDILGHLIDEKASVIVRTAAEGVSEDELVRDVNRLKAQWDIIEKKVKKGSAPALLYGEPDLTVRTVRDLFTEDFAALAIQGDGSSEDAYEAIEAYVGHVAPHLAERITRWDPEEQGDIFAAQRIDEQIAKALERKVFLPSGGSLIIDRTEAMTVIDVNTGRFTGTSNNLEATVTSNNLEAAEEIVRQLRLRDVGGIIVIDFIDMVLPANRDLLIRRLVECLSRDRTRHQVAEVTSLGLVQLTRKKIGTGLAEAFTEECEHCGGRGYHRFDGPVESQAPSDGGDRHQRHSGGNGGNGGGSNGGGRSRGGRRRGSKSE